MNSTKNQEAPIYDPFVDDDGQWVSVVEEYPEGRVRFSDGTMFYPQFQRGGSDLEWEDLVEWVMPDNEQ